MNQYPRRRVQFSKCMQCVCFAALLLTSAVNAHAAFGLTNAGGLYTVDTGAGLVFQVNQTNGNVSSIVYNGVEYQDQTSGRTSHLISGLGSSGTSVTATNVGTNYIKVTIQTDATNGVVANLTHYLIVRKDDNAIYMATYPTVKPGVGELRWITRLRAPYLPDGPIPSALLANSGIIESADVFRMADGTTRSKYFGDEVTRGKDRAMDMTYCGATAPGVGAWMVYGNRESSSGGPFFRDIQHQSSGNQEIYNVMMSGHNQTEYVGAVDNYFLRVNVLHGPYALVFNTGEQPAFPIDYSWIQSGGLGLTGWVPDSGRGVVTGTVSGIREGYEKVVGFSNTNAQYWAVVKADGTYTSPLIKPGTYKVTLYKQEFEVATNSVTVTGGNTNTVNLASTEPSPTYLWRLGDWDGTPAGFMNVDKVIAMHPSDVRMSAWNSCPSNNPFVVGTSDPRTKLPCYQWKTIGDLYIQFVLTAAQKVNSNLRIGITAAYAGARPQVFVNGSLINLPGATTQPDSRSLTIGTYRGNNAMFDDDYSITNTLLVVGTNTLRIKAESGSGTTNFLSAGFSIDCIEWDGPSPGTTPPFPSSLITKPGNNQIKVEWKPELSATHYILERATASSGPYTVLSSNWGPARYTDKAVTNGIPYYYRVKAVNPVGASPVSLVSSARPGTAAPKNLNVTAFSSNQIKLTWDSVSGADSYNVKRATASTGPFATIATGVTGTSYYATTRYSDTGVSPGTTYYYLVSAVNAFGESANSDGAAATPGTIYQYAGTNGIVCVEAEHFDASVSRNGYTWTNWPGVWYSGGTLMQALPNDGVGYDTGFTTNSPQLDYQISFNQTGTHYVWILGTGPDGGSDTVHVGLDGAAVSTSDRIGSLSDDHDWINATLDGPPAALSVPSTGAHTINLWFRESGVMVDKILLTTSSNYIATGYGPAETRGLQPPASPSGLAAVHGAGFISLDWNDNYETNVTSYNVYRSTTSGSGYAALATGLVSSSYSDTNILTGATYYYVVTAVNDVPSESGPSSEASAVAATMSTIGLANWATNANSGVSSATISNFNLMGGNALVVLVSGEGSATPICSVAFGGNSVANGVFVKEGSQYAGIYYVINPSTNVGNIVATFEANHIYALSAMSLSNVASAGDSDTFGEPDTSLPWNINYTGTAGGFVVAAMADNTFSGTPAPSITGSNINIYLQRIAGTGSVSAGRAHAYGGITSNGSFTETFSKGTGTSGRNAGALVAFNPGLVFAPATPSNLVASAVSTGQINLSWASADLHNFTLKRATNSGGPYTNLVAGHSSTSYSDIGLTEGTTYYYKVSAANLYAESADSGIASATTIPVLHASSTPGMLNLNWGASGWTLQMQTNSLSLGLGTNWMNIAGSTAITMTNITIDPTKPTVFYRLKQ